MSCMILQPVSMDFICLKGAHGGAILADEMGLGKNIQAISLITALIKQQLDQKALIRRCVIAVPTSLLNNWYAEFMKWSPQIRPLVIFSDSYRYGSIVFLG